MKRICLDYVDGRVPSPQHRAAAKAEQQTPYGKSEERQRRHGTRGAEASSGKAVNQRLDCVSGPADEERQKARSNPQDDG